MVKATKVTCSSKGPMEELVIFYAYLFPCKIGTNIQEILGKRKLPTLIPHLISSFLEDMHLYKYEILLKVLSKFILLILHGDPICLRIFYKGVVTYVCQVSFYFFNGVVETKSLITIQLHPYIFLTLDIVCILKKKNVRCLKLFPSTWKGRGARQSHQFVCNCSHG